jgi:hypothetical protein
VTPRKFRLISCEVLFRELCHTVASSPHQIDVGFLPKGLHDIGSAGMVERLQAAVDAVPPSSYDAILLGYGLCNNGIAGLRARHTPLVVPRAHDCMTLFLGSRSRYAEFFTENPGTYFYTSGWLERGEASGELRQLSIQHQTGMDADYEELVKKYGEDNARFLYDQLCDYTKHYRQITFIDMGIGPQEQFKTMAEQKAADRGWTFTCARGDMRLLQNLVLGEWNGEEFLVVPPGQRIAVSHDDRIVTTEPADG